MPRIISSTQTFAIKFIVPFVFVAITFLVPSGDRRHMGAVGLLFGVSLYFYYSRLKKVAIDSHGLVISKYLARSAGSLAGKYQRGLPRAE